MSLISIKDWCKHVAIFYDDNGVYVGKKKLKFKDKTFSYIDRSYNFLPDDCSFFRVKRFFSTTKYYQYNVNNPMPFLLNKKLGPVIDATAYKSILDSDLIKKLNTLSKSKFLDFLFSWKGLVLVLVIGAAIYYFSQGGKLT